jgi:hypothetical protein
MLMRRRVVAQRCRNPAGTPVREAVPVPYLLRLIVPDRPGMLGAVATAIGAVGADIVSLDVVERGPEGAVDDLLVQLPPGGLVDSLITSARSVEGVQVESLRPYLGADDLHRDLELVDALAARPAEALDLLVAWVPGVFRASWALQVEQAGDGVRVVRASSSAPEVSGPLPGELPLDRALRVPSEARWVPESWRTLGTELAVAPLPAGGAVLVGRVGGPRWRDGEVARLAHLAGITATVTGSARAGAEPA